MISIKKIFLKNQVDELIGDNAKVPLNKHILHTSMAIIVKGKYIPNNYANEIRSACGETDAKAFLMHKHRWKNLQYLTSNGNYMPNILRRTPNSEMKLYLSSFTVGWHLATRTSDRS